MILFKFLDVDVISISFSKFYIFMMFAISTDKYLIYLSVANLL